MWPCQSNVNRPNGHFQPPREVFTELRLAVPYDWWLIAPTKWCSTVLHLAMRESILSPSEACPMKLSKRRRSEIPSMFSASAAVPGGLHQTVLNQYRMPPYMVLNGLKK